MLLSSRIVQASDHPGRWVLFPIRLPWIRESRGSHNISAWISKQPLPHQMQRKALKTVHEILRVKSVVDI